MPLVFNAWHKLAIAAVGVDDALGFALSIEAIARELSVSVAALSTFLNSADPSQSISGFKLVLGELPASKNGNQELVGKQTLSFDIFLDTSTATPEVEEQEDNAESAAESTNETEDIASEQIEKIPEPPTPKAWQVWTYLERQRTHTLRCLGNFDAEWKAHRFIAEAERTNNKKIRIHYEIHPVMDDLITNDELEDSNVEPELIDVEVITELD